MYNPNDFDVISAYYQGVLDAIEQFAIWKNGEQVVGVLQRPKKQVFQELGKAIILAYENNKIIPFGWRE